MDFRKTLEFEEILTKHGITPAVIIQMPDHHPDETGCDYCDGYGHIIEGNTGRPCPKCREHIAEFYNRRRGKMRGDE